MVEYTLLPLKNTLVFQITKQSLADVKQALEYFKGDNQTSNGWSIKQVAQPQIDMASKTIFLRGMSKHKDNIAQVLTFNSDVERDAAMKEIKQAMLDFNYVAAFYDSCGLCWEQAERWAIFGWTGTAPIKIDEDGDANNKLPNKPFFSYN